MLIKNGLIKKQLYINIVIYTNNPYRLNNLDSDILFKLQLLKRISNKEEFIFYYDTELIYQKEPQELYRQIQDYNVLHKYITNDNSSKEEYIIFHTKCRFHSRYNYKELKLQIKNFASTFKTNQKIIIMGERIMPSNIESDIHHITTVYPELLELKIHNSVIDMTDDNIYDNLNFEHYMNDMTLVHGATKNILFGHGGQYCNCYCFSKKTFVYTEQRLMLDHPFIVHYFDNNIFKDI